MGLDFQAAKRQLTQDVLGWCQKNLPGGSVKGTWYLVRVPWRQDRTPSLGIHLQSGNWKDFGREGDRGDIIDLAARVGRCSPADVVRDATGA